MYILYIIYGKKNPIHNELKALKCLEKTLIFKLILF